MNNPSDIKLFWSWKDTFVLIFVISTLCMINFAMGYHAGYKNAEVHYHLIQE